MTLIGEDGILFRDTDHMGWFVITLLIFSWIIYTLVRSAKEYGPTEFPLRSLACFVMAVLYDRLSDYAYFVTGRGTAVVGDFSPDCIWFNYWVGYIYTMVGMFVTIRWIGALLKRDADRYKAPGI